MNACPSSLLPFCNFKTFPCEACSKLIFFSIPSCLHQVTFFCSMLLFIPFSFLVWLLLENAMGRGMLPFSKLMKRGKISGSNVWIHVKVIWVGLNSTRSFKRSMETFTNLLVILIRNLGLRFCRDSYKNGRVLHWC